MNRIASMAVPQRDKNAYWRRLAHKRTKSSLWESTMSDCNSFVFQSQSISHHVVIDWSSFEMLYGSDGLANRRERSHTQRTLVSLLIIVWRPTDRTRISQSMQTARQTDSKYD